MNDKTIRVPADEVPWSLSGALWGNDPVPVGVFPDGSLLYARGERYEYRFVHDGEGTIWYECRLIDSGTEPYRKVYQRAPWVARWSLFRHAVGVTADGELVYSRRWMERRYSRGSSFYVVERRPVDGSADVYRAEHLNPGLSG